MIEPAGTQANINSTRPVLVVDDHTLVRKLAVTVLIGEEFAVLSSGLGLGALEIVLSGSSVQFVVEDLSMPRMSGD